MADYRCQDLRGKSFRNGHLPGANFAGADVRDADFSIAVLVDVDFRGERIGVRAHWCADPPRPMVAAAAAGLATDEAVSGIRSRLTRVGLGRDRWRDRGARTHRWFLG
ncbi:MAG: pentapeptide repeat-containing protein [Acidimicrobiia bacterium]